ncbi:hypothetical protein R1sor_020342 [Riccia sorocarpa]|uniref:HNH homing endonuclease n=1 Tax=Riccia sorocarpa TaxID=122646 RepID=A0ABD3IIX8_9MARC
MRIQGVENKNAEKAYNSLKETITSWNAISRAENEKVEQAFEERPSTSVVWEWKICGKLKRAPQALPDDNNDLRCYVKCRQTDGASPHYRKLTPSDGVNVAKPAKWRTPCTRSGTANMRHKLGNESLMHLWQHRQQAKGTYKQEEREKFKLAWAFEWAGIEEDNNGNLLIPRQAPWARPSRNEDEDPP